jgi:hypothetical protein
LKFGELFVTNDGQCGAVHLGAVIASDAPTGAAANFHIIQTLPFLAHAAGENAEVPDETVYFIVGPFTDTPHWQTIKGGFDFGAKPIGVNVIPCRAVASLAIGMVTLTKVEGLAHGISTSSAQFSATPLRM